MSPVATDISSIQAGDSIAYNSQQLKQSQFCETTSNDATAERNSIRRFLRARITAAMSRTELLGDC